MNQFYQSSRYRKLYRSPDGIIFGVCRGLAEYADVPTIWVRAFTIIAILVTAFWPVALLYLACAIFLKPKPRFQPEDSEAWEFYQEYTHDKKWALSRLKRRFDILEKRTRRIESVVIDKEYDWDRRFNSGR